MNVIHILFLVASVLFFSSNDATAQTAATPPARAHTLTGVFRSHPKFHSRFLPTDRNILVYLPPGYDAPENKGRHYPVLYFHDGQNVFDGATSFIPGSEWRADEAAQSLITAGKIEPLIMVAVDNAGSERANEYLPTRGTVGIGQHKTAIGGSAAQYGRLLVEELKPFIDRTYRTKTDAANTGLCGSSLGGIVTLYLGLQYPTVFGKLGVVSPSVWWDDRYILRLVKTTDVTPAKLRIWLDTGTAEGGDGGVETLTNARLLRDALLQKGWRLHRNLEYKEAAGAQHNEKAWSERIGDILTFLFPSKGV